MQLLVRIFLVQHLYIQGSPDFIRTLYEYRNNKTFRSFNLTETSFDEVHDSISKLLNSCLAHCSLSGSYSYESRILKIHDPFQSSAIWSILFYSTDTAIVDIRINPENEDDEDIPIATNFSFLCIANGSCVTNILLIYVRLMISFDHQALLDMILPIFTVKTPSNSNSDAS